MEIKPPSIKPSDLSLNKTDVNKKQKPLGANHEAVNNSVNIEGSAKVNVSQHAKDINRIKQVATMAPDVDQEKVAKFKELIKSGKYNINAKAIADKMVDEEMMMGKLEN